MVGWHHQLNGHEFEQTRGDGKGQGSLACCSPWGHKESDTTEWLNNNNGHLGGKKPLVLSAFESLQNMDYGTRLAGFKPHSSHPPSDLGQLSSRFQFPHLCVCMCACMWAHTHMCTQLCLTLFHHMDCCPPGSSVYRIFQARIQEWVDVFPSRGFFPTQGLNPCLLHCMWIHHTAPPPGKPLPHLYNANNSI